MAVCDVMITRPSFSIDDAARRDFHTNSEKKKAALSRKSFLRDINDLLGMFADSVNSSLKTHHVFKDHVENVLGFPLK